VAYGVDMGLQLFNWSEDLVLVWMGV